MNAYIHTYIHTHDIDRYMHNIYIYTHTWDYDTNVHFYSYASAVQSRRFLAKNEQRHRLVHFPVVAFSGLL